MCLSTFLSHTKLITSKNLSEKHGNRHWDQKHYVDYFGFIRCTTSCKTQGKLTIMIKIIYSTYLNSWSDPGLDLRASKQHYASNLQWIDPSRQSKEEDFLLCSYWRNHRNFYLTYCMYIIDRHMRKLSRFRTFGGHK